MMSDDAPNVYIQQKMFEMLENSFSLRLFRKEQYIKAEVLREWMQKAGLLDAPLAPTAKTLRIERVKRMRLPDDTQE